ncbi:DUF5326 family protein [Streptomyces boninensis]|uniref:DUF5326 family protein n=1 Tax=Streptomyces boninensis TaxID=2039455 RepID=UPI003B21E1FE
MSEVTKGLPWWVKWVAIPIVAFVAFISLIGLIKWIVGIIFSVLVFAVVVAGLVFVVRKFSSSSDSRSDW